MKKLCVVSYVYGKKYQEFIPLYIIFFGESYPQYDLKIYIDNNIDPSIKFMVNILSEYYKNYEIIQNYENKSCLSEKSKKIQQIQRCQRWLFYDNTFREYKAIYIGDIDLLICKEEKDLYEQHIIHSKICGTPYSNISRLASPKSYSFKTIIRNIMKFGIYETFKYLLENSERNIKFSGLHFILAEEYFKKISPLFNCAYKELNMLAEHKSKKYNLCSFNNEIFLRDLILEAGLKDAPLSTGKPYNIETDANQLAYRPHHGIHLGIFRSPSLIKAENAIISSELYMEYYKQFKEIQKSDAYNSVCNNFSKYIVHLLDNMVHFYEQ